MASHNNVAQARRDGTVLGIPLGDLGPVQTVVMSIATGMAAFFLATFLAILALLGDTMAGHHPDFALAYRRVGFPIGMIVLIVTSTYLGTLYVRGVLRRHRAK